LAEAWGWSARGLLILVPGTTIGVSHYGVKLGLIDRGESGDWAPGFTAGRGDVQLEDAGYEEQQEWGDSEECLQIAELSSGVHGKILRILSAADSMRGSVSGVVPAWESELLFFSSGIQRGMKGIAEEARGAAHEGNGMERNRDSRLDAGCP
jgi:hypothetical protein